MDSPHVALCEQIIRFAGQLEVQGHVVGTSGNVSMRVPNEQRFLITPSSVPYRELGTEDIVMMDFEGEMLSEGRAPSIEHTVHLRVYREREDVGSVIHAHSPHASALAALRMPIPAFLDELTTYLGGAVAVSDYAASGSDELADNVTRALGDRAAVLLANHGTLCVGATAEKAYHAVQLVERAAQTYLLARSVGFPHEIPEEAIAAQRMIYEYLISKG